MYYNSLIMLDAHQVLKDVPYLRPSRRLDSVLRPANRADDPMRAMGHVFVEKALQASQERGFVSPEPSRIALGVTVVTELTQVNITEKNIDLFVDGLND